MKRISKWLLTHPSSSSGDKSQVIRERILTVILICAAFIGAEIYYINVRALIQQKTWDWILLYTLAFAWVCVIAFFRQIPYAIRVTSLLIILYGLGITSALLYGAAGDSRVWFFGATSLAGLLMGIRVGIVSILISSFTYIAIGWAMRVGILNLANLSPTLSPELFDGWTSTAIPTIAISTMVVVSIGVLTDGLTKNIQKSKKLTEELEIDQARLEIRSHILERRELQLRTAAEISKSVVAELDPDTLFQRVVDLLQSRFNLYYAGVFTIDQSGHFAVLRAGSGEAGEKMLFRNHQLPINITSMIGYAISQKEPLTSTDVGQETHHFSNPDLPHTRSELALPMISANRVLGAITVQSKESNAFDEDDIVLYQGISDILSTTLINANLFQQVQTNLEEVQSLQRQYMLDSWQNFLSSTQELNYTFEREPKTSANTLKTTLPPATLNLPLSLRDQVIGSLSIEADRTALTPQEYAFVEAVTQQTALALENIRLVDETQRTAQQDRIITAISEVLSQAMDVESVIKSAVREIGRLPNVSEVSVHIEPFAENS